MRILIYVPNISIDATQGDSIHIRELAENLSRQGNQVTIICKSGRNYRSDLVSIKRVTSPGNNVMGFLGSVICGLLIGLVIIKRRNHDLIYTRAGFAAGAFLLSRLKKVPYITEVNGLIRDETKVSAGGWIRKTAGYLLDFVESKAYKHGLHVIAVTTQMEATLIADYGLKPDTITVIPNGANISIFQPMDSLRAREEINLSGVEHLVVFVGYLVAWQGVEYLIESAPRITRECPKTRFLIVGDGPIKQQLEKLAQRIGVSEDIVFSGNVPYEKVPVYLNASDVCAAPFTRIRNEQCGLSPLKIYEYMACGKPIVASRITALGFVEQSNAGMLVEPDNPQELGNAIINLLRNEKLRQQMGDNGRKYVVENQSWESVASRVANTCERALTQK